MPTLNQVPRHQKLMIKAVNGEDLKLRLLELGFAVGEVIQVLNKAPFNGAIAVQLQQTTVALRTNEANLIQVSLID